MYHITFACKPGGLYHMMSSDTDITYCNVTVGEKWIHKTGDIPVELTCKDCLKISLKISQDIVELDN